MIASEAHKWRGNLADAYALGVEAARHLDAGSPSWFRAVGEVIALAGQLARIDDLGVWAAEAVRAEPQADASSAKIVALCRTVNALLQAGLHPDADRFLDHVQKMAPNLGRLDRLTAARVHNAWATRAQQSGHYRAAHAEHTAALIAYEEGGDLRNAALTRIHLAVELAELGEYEGAEGELHHALRIAERLGLSNVVGWAHNNLGNVLYRLGRADEARASLEFAIATGRSQGGKRLEISSRVYLARVFTRCSATSARRRGRRVKRASSPVRWRRCARSPSPPRRRRSSRWADTRSRRASAPPRRSRLIEPLRGAEGEVSVRLAHVEALAAVGDEAGARTAAAVAKQRLLSRAMTLEDDRSREAMLTRVAEHARLLALAERWLRRLSRRTAKAPRAQGRSKV